MVQRSFTIYVHRGGDKYNKLLKKVINNWEVSYPDMKKHKDSMIKLLNDVKSWNKIFKKEIGKEAFETVKGKTKNNRTCKTLLRKPNVEMNEQDHIVLINYKE